MSHHIASVLVGDFGDSKVLQWKHTCLVAESGTDVYEYIDGLPHLAEDSLYLPTLFDRFLGHNGFGKVSCGVFCYAQYWDSIIVLGAVKHVALCLKMHHGLKETLDMGIEAFKTQYQYILDDFEGDWFNKIIFPNVPVVEIPEIHWVHGKD